MTIAEKRNAVTKFCNTRSHCIGCPLDGVIHCKADIESSYNKLCDGGYIKPENCIPEHIRFTPEQIDIINETINRMFK